MSEGYCRKCLHYFQIWKLSGSKLDTARSDWVAGQVEVNSASDFTLVMEGKATNGGFAIDQLVFTPGRCKRKCASNTDNIMKLSKRCIGLITIVHRSIEGQGAVAGNERIS